MDEMRLRIPADTAAAHAARCVLRLGKTAIEGDVERAAIHMLAPLGDAETRVRELGVGLGSAICREHRRPGLTNRRHHVGEEVERRHVDGPRLANVMVAQQLREVRQRLGDRPFRVAIGAGKGLSGNRQKRRQKILGRAIGVGSYLLRNVKVKAQIEKPLRKEIV